MIKIEKFVTGPLATNIYIVCDLQRQSFIVDPGYPSQKILDYIKQKELQIRYILITHGHFDHVGYVSDLKKETGAKIAMSEKDLGMMVQSYAWVGKQMGYQLKEFIPDQLLKDGEVIKIGDIEIQILATPGHSPGSLSFYLEKNKVLFSGDTLFAGAVGRTDLPFASEETIWKSIRGKLFILPDDIRVLPGHGQETTIGKEKN